MFIKTILRQHRRDFTAIYECQHCGHTEEGSGYDDRYFHEKKIPNMECNSCGKKSPDNDKRIIAPKYPEGMQI